MRYIFASPGLASCRRRPLSSNVRPHTDITSLQRKSTCMKHNVANGKRFSFHARLENWAEGINYCALAVPAEVTDELGTKEPVLVLAQVNQSRPFHMSLFPVGGGQHYVRVKASVRKEAQVMTGDRVEFQFTVLDSENVEIPDDLNRALETQAAEGMFSALSAGKRNFIVRRINEAAKRRKREQSVSKRLWPRSKVRPNPSLKRSANGMPPGPAGSAVHCLPSGPGVLPSSPA